jgi:hypothetical protein
MTTEVGKCRKISLEVNFCFVFTFQPNDYVVVFTLISDNQFSFSRVFQVPVINVCNYILLYFELFKVMCRVVAFYCSSHTLTMSLVFSYFFYKFSTCLLLGY